MPAFPPPRRRAIRACLGVALLLGAIAILTAGERSPAAAGPGTATVIDGDTLLVDGEAIQLYGIDAPELGQLCRRDDQTWHCGREAAADLQKRIDLGGGRVSCEPPPPGGAPGATTFPTAVCRIGAEDLALVMVETGNAVALADGGPGYQDVQVAAREAGIGIWRGTFALPWQWRARRESDPGRWRGDADCLVKGAVDQAGRRTYYTPLDRVYGRIRLDPSRGERAFCSDEEASAAGWRRPGEG